MEVEEERKIPVFTVLKNGGILKNIFVINNSTPPPDLDDNPDQETEEILVLGRHPDCHIVLMHPSISRFHLQINSKPSSQKLFVTDLSSVHGTWVSEKKIEPGFRVELNEGDTLRVGGSTRVYRLHWVPLSRAYDVENPFVSASDVEMVTGKEDEHELKVSQNINLMSVENGEHQSLESVLEDTGSLFCVENCGLAVDKVISYKDEMESPSRFDDEISRNFALGSVLESESQQFGGQRHYPKYHFFKAIPKRENNEISLIGSEHEFTDLVSLDSSLSFRDVESQSASETGEETENKSIFREEHEQVDNFPLGTNSWIMSFSVGDISETKCEHVNRENQTPELLDSLQPLYEKGKQENEMGEHENSPANQELNSQIILYTTSSDAAAPKILEEAINTPRTEKGKSEFEGSFSASLAAESVSSSLQLQDVLSKDMDRKESQTPQSVFAAIENFENSKSCNKSAKNSHNIWSRRGKPVTPLQLQTSDSRQNIRVSDINAEAEYENQESIANRSIKKSMFCSAEAMEEEIFTPGKENYSPNTLLLKSLTKKLKREEEHITKALFSRAEAIEEVIFTPGKENYSPNALLVKSLKKKSKREEKHISKSCSSSLSKVSPNEEVMFISSDKENQTPEVLKQRILERPSFNNQVEREKEMVLKERRVERMPLQSLLFNSSGKSKSEASVLSAASRSCVSVNFTETMQKINSLGEGKTRWIIVVDTSSLLDKQSRKSLQLLQGLKGTHLIIPRMVIRELDCLKQRGSLFRRTTEASLALGWIEECMVKSEWWIHVQSSVEEAWPIAPTPAASSRSHFSEGYPSSSVPFSAHRSSLEIVSPTLEDRILDYALFNRKTHKDGQLVLISNDITLKIKAMAEGLICETAQEFRDSLVNPFSNRFLWADSSPRGLTWSVLDDVMLKEKYYQSPSKKSAKGDGAKGLKLILLYNSQYRQISHSVKTKHS